MDWKNKVIFITGAAGGIGKAISEELAKYGAKIAVCDIDEPNGEQLCKTLNSKYSKECAIFYECDVTDYPQLEETFNAVLEDFGQIDVVINNAGVMNDRLWELEVDVNLNGVIRGTLLALRFLGKDKGGKGGLVINIGSNCSLQPYTSLPIYSATKHAIIGLTRAYGDSYHESLTGVRVICVCPSATDTNLIKDVRKQLLSSDYEKAWKRDTTGIVTQKPEHVAKCLSQLATTAPSGSVWLIESSQPAKLVNFPLQ